MAGPTDTSLKALRHDLSALQDRERFIALCQREWAEEDRWKRDAAKAVADGYVAKRAPRSMVKEWIEEYRRMTPDPAGCSSAHFSFPLIYVSYVATLAQGQAESDLDLREATVRGLLLGGKSFDEAVMDSDSVKSLWQSKVGRNPRPSTLMKIIIEIVAKNPEITPEGLWDKLNQEQCPNTTIYDVDAGTISWMNAKGKTKDTPRGAIKDLLRRAREALKTSR